MKNFLVKPNDKRGNYEENNLLDNRNSNSVLFILVGIRAVNNQNVWRIVWDYQF